MAKTYKFESGLNLVYEKNDINKSTRIEVVFNCGSQCDGNIPGLSHFCEHMFFAGTDKLSKQQVADRYFNFGNVNAHTNTEDITFTATIISNKLAEYLTTVQDMVCNSSFTSDAIEEEKKIVIQEIVRDADNYPSRAYEFESYGLYGLEHYKNGELGNEESVSRITNKDLKRYVKKYFVKNNCSIFICSALSFNKVKNLVKKYFDDVMPSNDMKPLPYRENKFVKGNNIQQKKNDIGKNFVSVFLKVNEAKVDVKQRVCLGMLSDIISEFSTGITKELRLDNSLVYSVNSGYIINKSNTSFVISTEIS
ncbi:MAG: insulinase family protein, partial [Clostridia bacterium]|nr:insulinase family protein [Clostridia bacterium]